MAKKVIVKIDETKCDGCGKCVIACQEGVIKIIDGKAKLVNESSCDGLGACIGECPRGAITVEEVGQDIPACGCQGAKTMDLRAKKQDDKPFAKIGSQLQNWPIQLQLVNPVAQFLKGAHLLIAADCAGFSCPDFHDILLKGRILVTFCPKLDTVLDVYLKKLTEIFQKDDIKSVTVAHMEVPCCFGMVKLVRQALSDSGKDIPLNEIIVNIG